MDVQTQLQNSIFAIVLSICFLHKLFREFLELGIFAVRRDFSPVLTGSALYSMTNSNMSKWIIDSGCTNHMCFEKHKFETLRKHKANSVIIGDNSKLKVEGIGLVLISEKVVDDVLFVPSLRRNLISVLQISREGFSIEFKAFSWSIKKGFVTLILGIVKDNLYIVNDIPSKVCLATNVSSNNS